MSLEISAKTEALIALKAQEKGLSIDAFLERLLIDAGHKGYRIGAREWPWCSHPAASFGGRNEPVSGWLGRDAVGDSRSRMRYPVSRRS
jgi:hypothetical protein